MRSKLPKALSDERKRKEVEEKQRQVQQLEEELGRQGGTRIDNRDKNHTYNLMDIKEAVQIKPQDYSKTINKKEFQFVQNLHDGEKNIVLLGGTAIYDSPGSTGRKNKRGLRSICAKYDLT